MKTEKEPIPSEFEEQKALITWWREIGCIEYHLPQHLLFAIPNGGSRHPGEARRLKESGVLAGVPDLFFAVGFMDHHGLFIEMKKRKGGHISKPQWDMIYYLGKAGFKDQVCYGFEDAKKAIGAYLNELGYEGWPGGNGAFEIGTNNYLGEKITNELD